MINADKPSVEVVPTAIQAAVAIQKGHMAVSLVRPGERIPRG
jgi:hypothetical protein